MDRFNLMPRWLEFLEKRERKHDISKDTWLMILEFMEMTNDQGLQGYDPMAAWPVLIDEFVETFN